MRKLMRKLLILSALCLIAAVSPAPAVRAELALAGGEACTTAEAIAVSYQAVMIATCAPGASISCDIATINYLGKRIDASAACSTLR